MLGFFRRYEKTFLLVIFAPALIGMGITGAIISVVTHQGDRPVGRLFGEEVTQSEFDDVRMVYQRTQPNADDDDAWRFMALLAAARRAGLDVSEAEVGSEIASNMKWQVARIKASRELQEQKISIDSEEGRQKFQQIVMQFLLKDEPLTGEDYREAVKLTAGIPVREFERQQVREALVQRYLDTLREVATVTPDEVWEAYQDKHHRRVLELIELPAERYAPDLEAGEGKPGHVTDAQVKAFYERNEARYDEPRRVELAWVGLRYDDAKTGVEAPTGEQLLAFNERRNISKVDTQTNTLTNEQAVRDLWFREQAERRVHDVMAKVADKVEAAQEAGETPDLAKIAAEVKEGTQAKYLDSDDSTGLLTEQELGKHDLLAGRASERWFIGQDEPGTTSDVLGSPAGYFVLQTKQVERARTPKYEEIQAQVREDYAQGAEWELEEHYQQFKGSKYNRAPSWQIEAVIAPDAKFDGDHEAARKGLEQALDFARAKEREKKSEFPIRQFQSDPDVKAAPKLETETLKLDKKALEEHPLLGKAASGIPLAQRGKLSRVIETQDGEGWVVYRVVKQLAAEVLPLDEVKDQVRKDVRQARSLERAEAAAEDLLEQLAGKTDEALEAQLKELGLEAKRTEPFARDAVSLEGIPDAGQLVAEAFSAEAKVGGPFTQAVPGPNGDRMFLVRVAEKVEAAADQGGFADEYAALRDDLLRKKRMDFAQAQVRKVLLQAKGIALEHVAYARETRDGPGGVSGLELRQIFLPPDREIIDAWLEKAAREKIAQAEQALKDGSAFEAVVDRFSEDERTRAGGGQLPPAARGELLPFFGADFEEAAFSLRKDQISQPIRSTQGMHLVRLVKESGGKKAFQHLLVRMDPEARKLPASVREEAEAAARKKLEQAQAALEQGKPFLTVATEVGDKADPHGRGQPMEVGFLTHLERVALEQPLEWELPEGHAQADDVLYVPDVVEIQAADGSSTWHLFATSRLSSERNAGGSGSDQAFRDREVYHLMSKTKDRAEAARREMIAFLKEASVKEEGRPGWNQILTRFKELARRYSQAPSAAKGGALGVVRLEDAVRPYGPAFLEAVSYGKDGQAVQAGTRTGILESAEGFHIVEVVSTKTAGPDDEERRAAVADRLLEGTDWN